MAGMPEKVLNRAEQVLENLENIKDNNHQVQNSPKPSVKPVLEEPKQKPQLSLFE